MNYIIEVSKLGGCSLVEKEANKAIFTYTEETMAEMESFLDAFDSESAFIYKAILNAKIYKAVLNTNTEETMSEMESFLDAFDSESAFICVDKACLVKIAKSYAYTNNIRTTILECSKADFDEDQTTIEVKASANGHDVTFYVQTTDGLHRGSLGCLITSDESGGDEISCSDYPEFDLDLIIESAESYIANNYTDYEGYVIHETANSFNVLERNCDYFNAIASPYNEKYNFIAECDSFEEAQSYIHTL